MRRAGAIRALARAFPRHLVVCYAGAACEELYASGDEERYLYVLGSMGLSSSIGLGIARAGKTPVLAMEGDASLLMNLGALVTSAEHAPDDFVLAIIDNGQNASTGGQPTPTARGVDLGAIATAAGWRRVINCENEGDIAAAAERSRDHAGAVLLRVRVEPGDGERRVVDLAPGLIRDRARAFVERT